VTDASAGSAHNSASTAVSALRQRFRWWPVPVVLGVAALAQWGLWQYFEGDSTFSKMSVLLVWPAACFTLLLWWIFWSGLSFTVRRNGVLLLVGAQLLSWALLRIEDSDGDMVPRFAWRWTPTAEAIARRSWQTAPAAATPSETSTSGSSTNGGAAADTTGTEVDSASATSDNPVASGNGTAVASASPSISSSPTDAPGNTDPSAASGDPTTDSSAASTATADQPNGNARVLTGTRVAEADVQITEDDWPGYRGALRDGIVRGQGFRTNWDTAPPTELWRISVGPAWSSFATVGPWAVTQEQRDELEAVTCYHLATGKLQWIQTEPVRHQNIQVNGGDGPRATPTIVDGLVYSLGGTGLLNCLELTTGRRVWSRDTLADAGTDAVKASNLQWGAANSPLVVDQQVLVLAGGEKESHGKTVLAYDRMTGEPTWASGDFPPSYGSLRVEELLGERTLLAFHGHGLAGLSLADGRVLWDFPLQNIPKVNVAQPLRLNDHSLLIGSGYSVGAVRVDLSRDGDRWSAAAQWKNNRFKLKFNDAVMLNEFAFGLDDGILTCLNVSTGKTQWKGGRFGYGQILLFQDTLLVLSEDGECVLASAQPERYHELARVPMLSGTTWNHPVIARGKLLVRNGTSAACYDVAVSTPSVTAAPVQDSQRTTASTVATSGR
jgi:outer membrane protein assembly factor BamB